MNELINALYLEMIAFDRGMPDLIQHFTKVHAYAKLIAEQEGMPERERKILEAAALVHDIAIPLCEEKYGNSAGPLQEKEGPALVERMLPSLGFDDETIERVKWLVAHHHTITGVEQEDHRILLEADFLVNAFEGKKTEEARRSGYRSIFRTETGRKIFCNMFGFVDE